MDFVTWTCHIHFWNPQGPLSTAMYLVTFGQTDPYPVSRAGAQFNINNFGPSFGLENHSSFGPKIPGTKKTFKIGLFRDMSWNQNRISVRFSSQKSSQKFVY